MPQSVQRQHQNCENSAAIVLRLHHQTNAIGASGSHRLLRFHDRNSAASDQQSSFKLSVIYMLDGSCGKNLAFFSSITGLSFYQKDVFDENIK